MAQVATKQKEKAEDIINNVLNKDVVSNPIINQEPERFTVRVLRLARNKNFVYAGLDGALIVVFHPRNRQKSVGRTIKVERAEDLGENRYRVVTEFI